MADSFGKSFANHFQFQWLAFSQSSILRFSCSHPILSLAEFNQTQFVPAQSLCARPEWRNREKLLVDTEPRRGKEWQISTPTGHFHGQQQQVHKEPWTSCQEKGQLRGELSTLPKYECGDLNQFLLILSPPNMSSTLKYQNCLNLN